MSLLLGHIDKRLTNIKISNIYCCPLIHQASQFLVEDYQVGQKLFPLCKSMLTPPNEFLVLQVFRNGFNDYLFHYLSREQAEADWPVPAQILLLALLDDRSDICFLSFLRSFL